MVQSLNGWDWSKSRSQELLPDLHVGAGARALGPSLAAFAGALVGSWITVGQLGLQPLFMECLPQRRRLYLLYRSTGPSPSRDSSGATSVPGC